MNQELFVRNDISIDAPASVVWDLLVNPEQTKKYMYGSEAISDWQPGSTLIWKGIWEGKEMIFVKGHVVRIEPEQLLVYTVIDPNNPAIPDVPENYLTVTYHLEEENGQTKLKVTQGNYATAPDGQQRYEKAVAEGGWSSLLEEIRRLAETV